MSSGRVYELSLSDDRTDLSSSNMEHFEEEKRLIRRLRSLDEDGGLDPGDATVRVLSSSPELDNAIGTLIGIGDGAALLENGKVKEEELRNPLD